MRIGALKELWSGEARVAMTPDSAQALQKLRHECLVETGPGLGADLSDEAYRGAGVTVVDSADAVFAAADVIVKVRPPMAAETEKLATRSSYLSNKNNDVQQALILKRFLPRARGGDGRG